MGQTAPTRPLTVDEYLQGELASDVRHEFVNGEVVAMVGTSKAHNSICVNLISALNSRLRGGPCRPYMSDIKVRVRTGQDDRFYYPDLLVSCTRQEPSVYYTEKGRPSGRPYCFGPIAEASSLLPLGPGPLPASVPLLQPQA